MFNVTLPMFQMLCAKFPRKSIGKPRKSERGLTNKTTKEKRRKNIEDFKKTAGKT